MDFNRFIGKKCKVVFRDGDQILYYKALITDIDDEYISFTDIYDKKFLYKRDTLENIREID